MRRRRYIATIGTLVSAGCVGGQPGNGSDSTATGATETATPTVAAMETPTPTGTSTPTETPTSTPEPEPEILQANPVTRWGKFGDVIENPTSAFGSGALVSIGSRHELPVVDGKLGATVQCNIYDGDERIEEETSETSKLVDPADTQKEEVVFRFDIQGMGKGTYGAEIIAQDDRFGTRARSNRIEFDIVGPLTAGEVEVVEVDHPASITAEEPFWLDVVFKNVSDRDSSIVSDHSLRRNLGDWATADTKLGENLAAGEEFTWERTGIELPRRGEYTERLDGLDLTWSFDVER
jgi:hypothetical protein